MKIHCPSCHRQLAAEQLNVAADVAVCPSCDEAFSISALLATGQCVEGFDIHEPPRGAWFEDTGTGWRIGASTRSAFAFFLVPFMCVWSGFSLGGIYGTQVVAGQFSLGMSLFGIPFVIGTLLFGSIALMTVCGRVVVSVDRGDGRVFTGVGSLGWTRRFDWSSIVSVEETWAAGHRSGSSGVVISLIGQSRVSLGGMLTEVRRHYVLQGLRTMLSRRER